MLLEGFRDWFRRQPTTPQPAQQPPTPQAQFQHIPPAAGEDDFDLAFDGPAAQGRWFHRGVTGNFSFFDQDKQERHRAAHAQATSQYDQTGTIDPKLRVLLSNPASKDQFFTPSVKNAHDYIDERGGGQVMSLWLPNHVAQQYLNHGNPMDPDDTLLIPAADVHGLSQEYQHEINPHKMALQKFDKPLPQLR